jgi:H+-transporting ATPase
MGQKSNKATDAEVRQLAEDQTNAMPLIEMEKDLGTSPDGLSQAEALQRLSQYGYNELREEKVNPILRFLSYFWGPIPWMIEIAAILSGVVRHWEDFGIILTLLLANGIVGFWEEHKASNTIAALEKKLAPEARVKRNNKWTTIPSRELVPGDIVHLHIGAIVPADAKLLEGDGIEVDQSALTGESLPVTKKQEDKVFSSSIIQQGENDALVYATGQDTYLGRTAHLLETTHTVSHFQRAVLKIGNYLIIAAAFLMILILAVALFRENKMITTLEFALVLTVAAIPVAMPTVLSVTLAVGARLLALKQAIVTRLTSIEEMAGIDVLCSDKTGTLTQNKLTLGEPTPIGAINPGELILNAALASQAEYQDPIDMAVLSSLKDVHQLDSYHIVHFLPFDPVHKRTEATIKGPDGNIFKVTKGAPQVIMDLSANASSIQSQVEEAVNKFASRGFRTLGVARTEGKESWQFQGVIPLYDPPREDSRATIETAEQMGIKVKMLTGDNIAIAKEISSQLRLGKNITDANIFSETQHYQAGQLSEIIENTDGFAQVFPEHKYHIVQTLQQRGHIVGMTGDGVNDAPALKKADAGIAVSGATDAARSAADIVLLTPGLSVIIDAIKESRKIFQRMNHYATYRIAETIRVLLFMTLSILVFNFYPVTAVMIVLLALLNDGAILSIAYDRTRYSDKPEKWNMHIVLGLATVLGITGVFASFGLFYLGERVFHLSSEMIQTLMYLKLSVAGHLTIFITRTRGPFWSYRPAPILLAAVFVTQMVATFISVFGLFMAPIGWKWALLVWGYALAWFIFNDQVKLVALRIFDPHHPGLLAKKR